MSFVDPVVSSYSCCSPKGKVVNFLVAICSYIAQMIVVIRITLNVQVS